MAPLSRERQRVRKVEVWEKPRLVKRPIYDEYRVEELIRDFRFCDDIPSEPKYYVVPTENVVRRVFAYRMEHVGHCFTVWPIVPTAAAFVEVENLTVPAGGEAVVAYGEGQGQIRYFAVALDYPEMTIELWCDGRLNHNFTIKKFYDYFENSYLPRLGQVVKYDDTNNIYSFAADYDECFSRSCKLLVKNPDSVDHKVLYALAHCHIHKLTVE